MVYNVGTAKAFMSRNLRDKYIFQTARFQLSLNYTIDYNY